MNIEKTFAAFANRTSRAAGTPAARVPNAEIIRGVLRRTEVR